MSRLDSDRVVHDPFFVTRPRWFAATMALLLLTIATSPSVPWILCVGADGHRVLERTLLPDLPCTSAEGDECEPDACNDCTDIDLSSGFSLRSTNGSGERSDALAHSLALAYEPDLRTRLSRIESLPDVSSSGSRCNVLSEILLPTVLIRC